MSLDRLNGSAGSEVAKMSYPVGAGIGDSSGVVGCGAVKKKKAGIYNKGRHRN